MRSSLIKSFQGGSSGSGTVSKKGKHAATEPNAEARDIIPLPPSPSVPSPFISMQLSGDEVLLTFPNGIKKTVPGSNYIMSYLIAKYKNHFREGVVPFYPYPEKTFNEYNQDIFRPQHLENPINPGIFPFPDYAGSVGIMSDNHVYMQREGWVNVRLMLNIPAQETFFQVLFHRREEFLQPIPPPGEVILSLYSHVVDTNFPDEGFGGGGGSGGGGYTNPNPGNGQGGSSNLPDNGVDNIIEASPRSLSGDKKKKKTNLKMLWKAIRTGKLPDASSSKDINNNVVHMTSKATTDTHFVASALVHVREGDFFHVQNVFQFDDTSGGIPVKLTLEQVIG